MVKIQVVEESVYIVREVPVSFSGEHAEITAELFNEIIDAQLRLREANQHLAEYLEGGSNE